MAAFDVHIAQNFVLTNIAVSVGVSVGTLSAEPFYELFEKADKSLSEEKRQKKELSPNIKLLSCPSARTR